MQCRQPIKVATERSFASTCARPVVLSLLPLEVDHEMVAVETDDFADQVRAHVTAAHSGLSLDEKGDDHAHGQRAIARERQMLPQHLSILRDDGLGGKLALVAQYAALGMSKTGLLAVEHDGAVGG